PTTTGLDRATLQTTITTAPVVIVPPPGDNLATPQTTPPQNQAPAPTAPAIHTTQNTSGTSQISPNDPDAGDTFTFAVTTLPAHGTASVDAMGRVTYTPALNFTGNDSLAITVTDNETPPLSGAVTISVTVANRPPAPTALPISARLPLYPGQKFAAGSFP